MTEHDIAQYALLGGLIIVYIAHLIEHSMMRQSMERLLRSVVRWAER